MTLLDIEKNYPYSAPIIELTTSFLHELRIRIWEFKMNPKTSDYEYLDNFFYYINTYEERITSEDTLDKIERSRIAKIDTLEDRIREMSQMAENRWGRYNRDIHYYCTTIRQSMEEYYNFIWEE